MKYYELALDGDQADGLVVAVLKDSLETVYEMKENGLADDDEEPNVAEALKTVINYFSVPEEHV